MCGRQLKIKESSVCSIHDEGLPELPIKSLKNKAGRNRHYKITKPNDNKGKLLSAKGKGSGGAGGIAHPLLNWSQYAIRLAGWRRIDVQIVPIAPVIVAFFPRAVDRYAIVIDGHAIPQGFTTLVFEKPHSVFD